MILYRTPGRSRTRPPRTSTMECSWRLWPTPGIYVVTSILLVNRARATLRNAELGFLGVCVYTRMQTPRFSGQDWSAGDFVFVLIFSRPFRTNCANVGTALPQSRVLQISFHAGASRRMERCGWPTEKVELRPCQPTRIS